MVINVKRGEIMKKNLLKVVSLTVVFLFMIKLVFAAEKEVIVSGEVSFEGYKTGNIRISACTKRLSDPPYIAITEIPEPGKYSLEVPVNIGEIYISADTVLPTEKGIRAEGEYEKNPLKIEFLDIKGADIAIDTAVVIAGEVSFEGYKTGNIRISAYTGRAADPPYIAITEIPEPGKYSLEVPVNIGKIYISADTVLPTEKGIRAEGKYEKNPLKIKFLDIKGVDMVILD